jgi:hypothetical protein
MDNWFASVKRTDDTWHFELHLERIIGIAILVWVFI